MTIYPFPFRIYFEDTDAGGIVYYANYLKFAERARTEWLREHGFQSRDLHDRCGILIVVKAVDIDYKSPARLDDSLVLDTVVLQIGGTSMTLSQNVRRGDKPLCDMKITLVCVSAQTFRPARWPSEIHQIFHPLQIEKDT